MNPFQGKFFFVFNPEAYRDFVKDTIAVAKKTGYGLFVKYHDGSAADDGNFFKKPFIELQKACKDEGILFRAWGYLYGNKFGKLSEELDAVCECVIDSGVEGYIFDIESEWETPNNQEWGNQVLGRMVLNGIPSSMLAFTSFWNARFHPLPLDKFCKICDTVIPQDYFNGGKKFTPASQKEMIEWSLADFHMFKSLYTAGDIGSMDITLDFLDRAAENHSLWTLDGNTNHRIIRYLELLNKEANMKFSPNNPETDKALEIMKRLREIYSAIKI